MKRLAFSNDDMSILESSSRNMFIAAPLIALVRTYFCLFVVFSEMPKLTIQGRWSDNWLRSMGDEMDTCCFFMWSFQNTSSTRLHECLANLVGNDIFGKKLLVHIKSKNSPNFSRSEICNRFILKSPTIAAYVFSLLKYLYYRRKLWYELLYIAVIIIIIAWGSIYVADCKCAIMVATIYANV